MPISPAVPFPKNPGDPIRSTDWNQTVNEVIRLDEEKVDRSGDTINGPLTIEGSLGLGAPADRAKLEIHNGILKVSSVAVGRRPGVGSPRGNGNRVNLGSNNHATLLLSSNLFLDDDGDALKISTTHNSMAGAAIKIPGNGQPRQNHIEFWSTPTGAVTAGADYGAGVPLMVIEPTGNVGIGTENPNRPLTIQGSGGTYLNVKANDGTHEVLLGADNNGGIVSTMTNHDLHLRAGGNDLKMIIKANGNVGIGNNKEPGAKLDILGALKFSTTNDAENDISIVRENLGLFDGSTNNLKVALSKRQLLGQSAPIYSFLIGHPVQIRFGGPPINSFASKFRVNSLGDGVLGRNLSVQNITIRSGSKAGYVIDYFINRTGDSVEQGDVVVLGQGDISNYWATGNDIPIPEVDLTTKEYDTRVCGVVAKVVIEETLPFVEGQWPEGMILQEDIVEEELIAIDAEETEVQPSIPEHPLKEFAAIASEELDQTIVQDKLVGMMVTLGAYSYCKVDADIAPIEAGDLLTTSTTKGHAQKVLEPHKAIGAIIGKALSPLKKGKSKIPVLVMLQ